MPPRRRWLVLRSAARSRRALAFRRPAAAAGRRLLRFFQKQRGSPHIGSVPGGGGAAGESRREVLSSSMSSSAELEELDLVGECRLLGVGFAERLARGAGVAGDGTICAVMGPTLSATALVVIAVKAATWGSLRHSLADHVRPPTCVRLQVPPCNLRGQRGAAYGRA